VSREHHHLYNKAAWRKTREAQLRDHPLCRMHLELGQTVVATIADHIVPHKGDLGRFFDRGNLQSLCKPCHDNHKQAQDRHADGLLRGAGLDGRPLDLAHPWHRPVEAGGAGEKSGAAEAQTGRFYSFAGPRNQQGESHDA